MVYMDLKVILCMGLIINEAFKGGCAELVRIFTIKKERKPCWCNIDKQFMKRCVYCNGYLNYYTALCCSRERLLTIHNHTELILHALHQVFFHSSKQNVVCVLVCVSPVLDSFIGLPLKLYEPRFVRDTTCLQRNALLLRPSTPSAATI